MKDVPLNKQYQQFFNGTHEDIDGVCKFLNDLRKKGLEFHAVIASEDMLAAGAIKYAKMNHLEVPKDLSVIGYNNSLLTTCSEPEITSVDNHLETLCSQLVKTCIGTLSGEEMPQKTIFSGGTPDEEYQNSVCADPFAVLRTAFACHGAGGDFS